MQSIANAELETPQVVSIDRVSKVRFILSILHLTANFSTDSIK
ncbi:protein of unknown function [Vibrio tapetis subsp. tapetis]|uniref:Uncharacterized protein n=1 Tax=Vibrio tapetis subsp. tapetis TaxID=1671868 RepID=A0A2N8ZC25_9VIBR|nr:protein of unknown function [Vibrio tapetis subsp. tapetis]